MRDDEDGSAHDEREGKRCEAISEDADRLEKRSKTGFELVREYLESSAYMLPPSSFEFNVTTIAPIHTITKTSANSGPPSFVFPSLEPWRIVAMNVHSTSGPQRSHSFSKLFFSFGYSTCLNLLPTARTSRSCKRNESRVLTILPAHLRRIFTHECFFDWFV